MFSIGFFGGFRKSRGQAVAKRAHEDRRGDSWVMSLCAPAPPAPNSRENPACAARSDALNLGAVLFGGVPDRFTDKTRTGEYPDRS